MGIHNLKTFVDSHFSGWRRTEVRGHVVIDGDNVKHQLNSQDWSHGGQFFQYERSVRAFYSNLRRSGITPVVVLDGIDHTGEKWGTILRRSKERLRVIHKQMTKENRGREVRGSGVFPSLSADVYIQVLADLHVEFVVVDGEADGVIVQIANFYNCPVLSSDSDFYMYKLTGGYLPLDRLQKDEFPVTGDLYRYEDFCAQFQFEDESLRFIIPTLVGNDFLSPVLHDRNHYYREFIEEQVGDEEVPDHPLGIVVCFAATFHSLDDFQDETARLRCLSRGSKMKIEENCIKACEMYDCDRTLRIDDIREVSSLSTSTNNPIPPWIVKNYRRGRFSSFLFSMIVTGKHILGTFIDDVSLDSSTSASQSIRRCIYGIVQETGIFEEYIRAVGEARMSSQDVSPQIYVNGDPLPSLNEISRLPHSKRENLLYSILHCEYVSFAGINYQLWLALAAAVFWHKVSQPPSHLVKSILLCFVVCFNHLEKVRHFRNSEGFRLSHEWISNLHYFAQWQSCYKDSISLNQLLNLPLYIISPSFLYNGQLVMHLAEPPNLGRMLGSFEEGDASLVLYRKLVRVVLEEVDVSFPRSSSSSLKPTTATGASGHAPWDQQRKPTAPGGLQMKPVASGGRWGYQHGPSGQSKAFGDHAQATRQLHPTGRSRGRGYIDTFPGQTATSGGKGHARATQCHHPPKQPPAPKGRGHVNGPPGQTPPTGGKGHAHATQYRHPPKQPTATKGSGHVDGPSGPPGGKRHAYATQHHHPTEQPTAPKGRGRVYHPQGQTRPPAGRGHACATPCGPLRQPGAFEGGRERDAQESSRNDRGHSARGRSQGQSRPRGPPRQPATGKGRHIPK